LGIAMSTPFKVLSVCFSAIIAMQVSASSGACLAPPLTAEAIDSFKLAPGNLVSSNADARTVEAMTRDLAGTDARLAADLIKVAQSAAPRFRTAIAAGLAQAAVACTNVDQKGALAIQEAVASFEDAQFQASFAMVAGDLSTAATDAANSSAASSAGSVAIVNPTATAQTNSVRGSGGSASFVTVGAVSALSMSTQRSETFATPNTTINAANVVSPIR
jgi:hypothetical protein